MNMSKLISVKKSPTLIHGVCLFGKGSLGCLWEIVAVWRTLAATLLSDVELEMDNTKF